MERWFNTSGPCFPDEHYMLPPERRLGRVMELIGRGKCITLHAARGAGKTTCAQWLTDHYNAGERYRALLFNLDGARDQPDPTVAFPVGDLAARSPRPLVVLFDGVDGLAGASMTSFLTQLRSGYLARRWGPFPHSVVLVGQRDLRDVHNIPVEATTIGPFTEPEVAELLAQHTAATGQRFDPEAVARIHDLSQGHPWLVNAMADQITDRDVCDRSVAVTAAHVDAAKETIILERRTHIDSLIHKLHDPRVRRIVDAMLAGERVTGDTLHEDLAYTVGLGIVRVVAGHVEIANPIYREVIPRALSYDQQVQIMESAAAFVRPDGALDMPRLMAAWQTFWRKDGHLAAGGFSYQEAGPHLMLMAFLQRVVNGGGRVEREYGLGRGALDLIIEWRGARHAIEVKLRRDTQTEADALEQVARYIDAAGLDEGWLVMFDLRSTQPWEQRLTTRTLDANGKRVHLVGC